MKLVDYIKNYTREKNVKDEYYLNAMKLIVISFYNIDSSKLVAKLKEEIPNNELSKITKLFDKLIIENIPVEYITSNKNFYNENYYVDENVLIPRDDTEILVAEAIKLIKKYNLKNMLDLCTGSGCIGISICNNSNILEVGLLDISSKALKIANKNILLNKCKKNIYTIQSNLFKNIKKDKKFDLITANPPYIKSSVINTLDKSVKKEPLIALDGGITGLDFYIKIINDSKDYLNDNAFVIFEIGYDQKDNIKKYIDDDDNFEYINCIKDYSNNDRVIICRFHQM